MTLSKIGPNRTKLSQNQGLKVTGLPDFHFSIKTKDHM